MPKKALLLFVTLCFCAATAGAQTADSEKILEMLGKILNRLDELTEQNRQLRQELAELKAHTSGSGDADQADHTPVPAMSAIRNVGLRLGGNPARVSAVAQPAPSPRNYSGTPADQCCPSVSEIADEVQARLPESVAKYASFNFNVGPSSDGGNVSFTGQGRGFIPFARRHALQIQGEFLHYSGREEGQFDVGLVNRWGRLQASGFGSFKHVRLGAFDRGGALGQAAMNLDYVFNRGRFGFVGAKGFLDGAVVQREQISQSFVEETYLRVVDQAGFSAAIAAWGPAWFEGNFGAMFRRGGANKPGGTVRYIHPLNSKVALTLEAGLNETLIGASNQGRFVVGLQFGGWLSPERYSDRAKDETPVPVDVPRVRYELLKRRVRTGNAAPVADAGPDLVGIEGGRVTLDGSASFDPEQEKLTFRWEQVGEPRVELEGADTERASFVADEGKTYHFRLTVMDPQNAKGTDTVTVSTVSSEINIKTFQVTPSTVKAGDPVVVEWEVENAERVVISPKPGDVELRGTSSATVDETTEFVLEARRGDQVRRKTVTVTVVSGDLQIVRFTATPDRVKRGEKAALSWTVVNADTVELQPIGGGQPGTGSVEVSPAETTTYTLTARNEFGYVSAQVIVAVDEAPGLPVRILEFKADNTAVERPGDPAQLTWRTENAVRVVITPGVGDVEPNGSVTVNPAGKTIYNLLAYGQNSEVTAVVILDIQGSNLPPVAVAKAIPQRVIAPVDAGKVTLDGTESYDPDDDMLTYRWRSIGRRKAAIREPAAAVTTAMFLDGFGEYEFELVVTDSKGASDLDTVKVQFVDP